MQSISDALNRLYQDGVWFTRASELRLWAICIDTSLRGTVVELTQKFEFHADNRCAWPILLDAHTEVDDGWQLRANNLLVDWERRVAAFAADGVQQGRASAVASSHGLAVFRSTLAAVLAAMCSPLEGLVVVFAPPQVQHAERFAAELLELLGDPRLARCRWVLVVERQYLARTLLHALGERGLVTSCEIDEAQQRKDLAALLSSPAARFGAAWPVGVEPPPRVDDPPPLSRERRDAGLRAAGIDPAYVDQAPTLRSKLFSAALAMRDGRGADAIVLQREACQLCAGLGLFELQVMTQVALASYLSGLGQREQAKQELHKSITLADAQQLGRVGCQARLALGLLCALDRDHGQAMQVYTDAARTAEAGDEALLAIEAWRMAGQHAANLGVDQNAATCFDAALRVASNTDARLAASSSAAEAARALASIYERRAMPARAASLHAHADMLERGEVSDVG